MSRKHLDFTPDIHVIYGYDDILGTFIDICDRRYASSGDDLQGEGYVLEWSEQLGFTTNLIEAPQKGMFQLPMNLLDHKDELIRLCNEFIEPT